GVLPPLHPAHGEVARFRVSSWQPLPHSALFRRLSLSPPCSGGGGSLSLRLHPFCTGLNLGGVPLRGTRTGCRDELAGSFYKRHAVTAAPPGCVCTQTHEAQTAPTAGRERVSGALSPPLRGSFHPSLTVLVHYRWPVCMRALEGGPPSFPQDFSCPAVLGYAAPCTVQSSPTGLSPPLAPLPSGFG